jgi:hypothetical protein
VKWLAAVLPVLVRDLAGLAGAAGVSYGCWQMWKPLGWVAGGALLIAGAWLMARGGEAP